MEGDLQELADISASKNIIVDLDEQNNQVEDKLEESKQEADSLEQEIQLPAHHKKMTKAQLSEAMLNIEREKSRLGNELGDLRKTVDEFINKPVERKPIDAETLLDSPDETLNSAISENDKIKQLEDRLNKYEQSSTVSKFYQTHPDADELANSAEFQQYLQLQPIAGKAAAVAAQNQDYEMLGDVMDSFKALKGKAIKDESSQKREKDLNDAQMESGSAGGSSKKVYKRSDLVRMRIQQPDQYAENEAEYLRAYAEGRVK